MSAQVSDTHAAIRVLLADFPAEGGLSPFPVILKHQIYTIVHNRSSVEKELDQLIQDRIVRRFDSATGTGECFICLNEDYVNHLNAWSSIGKNSLISSFCDFATRNLSVDVTRIDLETVLDNDHINDLVRLLTSRGYLTMKTQRMSAESYLFSVPSIGAVVQNILNGRREVLAMLKRSKFRELLETKLLSYSLKKTCMKTKLVLRDLVGSDRVISTKTTSGPLIRMKAARK